MIVGVHARITSVYGVDVFNNAVDTSGLISVIGVYDGHAHDVGVFDKVIIWFYIFKKIPSMYMFHKLEDFLLILWHFLEWSIEEWTFKV